MTVNHNKSYEKEILESGSANTLHIDESDLKKKYNTKNLTVNLTKLPFEFDENGKPKLLNSGVLKNYITLYSDGNQFQCSVCEKQYNNRKSFSNHIYTHMETTKRRSRIVLLMFGSTGRSITRCMALIFIVCALYYYSTDIITRYVERPSWFP